MLRVCVSAWAMRDDLRRSFPPTSMPNKVANVMMPNPPTWMSAMITVCPNGDQYVAVSTVVRPVTHTAETVVKAAVSTGGRVGPGVEYGSESRTVPTTIAARNASGTMRAGCANPSQTLRTHFLLHAAGPPNHHTVAMHADECDGGRPAPPVHGTRMARQRS